MGDKEEKAALATALKAAKTGKMHFALILKGAADGVLLVCKSAPTGKQIAEAKTKCGGTKIVSGECHGDGDQIVFETAENPDPNWTKAVKEIAKRDGAQTIKADFRLAPAPPQANVAPAAMATGGFAPGQSPNRAPAKPGMLGAQRGTAAPVAPTAQAPSAAPPGFTAGQAPTRAPAKPGMLGGQRGTAPVNAPTAQAPTTAPTAPPTGFTAGQAPNRAPTKPGMMGAQRGAAPPADTAAKEQWQHSLKEVETPLMQSIKENKGDVGKMKALFQDSRKQAESGNFEMAMDDLTALRALFGNSGFSTAPPAKSLDSSGKGKAAYVDTADNSSVENESNEQESNEDESQYVENLSGTPQGNDPYAEPNAYDPNAAPGKFTRKKKESSANEEAAFDAEIDKQYGDDTPEYRDAMAKLKAGNSELDAKAEQEQREMEQAEEAMQANMNAHLAEMNAEGAQANAANSAAPSKEDESAYVDSINDEDESNEDESEDEQGSAAPKPVSPALKKFDGYVEQFTKTLNEFKTARESYEAFREKTFEVVGKSSKAARELSEMVSDRVSRGDPTKIARADEELVRFFQMLTSATSSPDAYLAVASMLKAPARGEREKVSNNDIDAVKREAEDAKKTAELAREGADEAWKDFEKVAEEKGLFQRLREAEATMKAAQEAVEKARAPFVAAQEAWDDAKMKWDRAGIEWKEADGRVKKLESSGAPPNAIKEARSKAEAAKQALDAAHASSDAAAKTYGDLAKIATSAGQAAFDAEGAVDDEKKKIEAGPDAAKAMRARGRAEREEMLASEAELKFNQLGFQMALDATGDPSTANGPKENSFLTPEDRKTIDKFFGQLKTVPDLHTQWEQSSEGVWKVATTMQAMKVDTDGLVASIPLKQYSMNFAAFARTIAAHMRNQGSLEGLEAEVGFDPFDMSLLKEARAALAK